MSTDRNGSGFSIRNQGNAHSVFLADEEQTVAFGRLLAMATADENEDARTRGGCFFLQGDLGAGKTTLARGVLRAFDYAGAVKSPTYTLVEPYEFDGLRLYHFDLYRLGDPEEVEFLGVEDYFSPGNLCLIEWPEKGVGHLPAPDLTLTLQAEDRGRRLSWQAGTASGRKMSQRLIELATNPGS